MGPMFVLVFKADSHVCSRFQRVSSLSPIMTVTWYWSLRILCYILIHQLLLTVSIAIAILLCLQKQKGEIICDAQQWYG